MTSLRANDFWSSLRRVTPSRIGLARVGEGVSTRDAIEFEAAHARARDAVHAPLDVAALTVDLRRLGIGEPSVVASLAADRAEYLRRPDLGRRPATLDTVPAGSFDIGFVVADGLSTRAVAEHAAAFLRALIACLGTRYSLAPPVIATQARVAIGDHIGERLGAQTVLVLIGERPGLSVSDSLGVYLTHRPRPGLLDSERNCVSNIHPLGGLSYPRAAAVITALVDGATRLGASGVLLKDESRVLGDGEPSNLPIAGTASGQEAGPC